MLVSKSQQGFSLIELLVAVAVVSLVLVAVTSAVTYSLKNSRVSKEKALSVRYAQESIEWLRSQRSLMGWNSFYEVLSGDASSGTVTYCLTDIPTDTTSFIALENTEISECTPLLINGVDSIYTRSVELVLDNSDPNYRNVTINSLITWDSGSKTSQTLLTETLHEWR